MTNITLANMFQSHAGSIEAYQPRSSRDLVPSFQSHAGSIEARWMQPLRNL